MILRYDIRCNVESSHRFYPKRTYPVKSDRLLDAVLTQAHKSNATARSIIEAWLRAFSLTDPSVVRTGLSIRQLLIARSSPRLEVWRNADQRVGLFDAREGPRKLASELVSSPETVDVVL